MKRSTVSLLIAVSFLTMSITGILMYFQPFQTPIAALHTSFGLVFLIGAGWHIYNNFKPLKKYVRNGKSKLILEKNALLIAGLSILSIGAILNNVLGSQSLYDWGNQYRSTQLGKDLHSKEYEEITLKKAVGNYTFEIEGRKGLAFQYPMFAIWIEDQDDNYLQTIYASTTIGTSVYEYQKGKKGKYIVRRPSGLPFWAHRRNIRAADGLMVPLENAPDLDGFTGATPLKDFVINTKGTIDSIQQIKVFFEVNQSYDWNDYYSEDRFPMDSIYTISGQSGQPSLVYSATVDLSTITKEGNFFFKPVGHGHHSGKNGNLYEDLSTMDTAFDIVDRIILTVSKGD